MPMLPFPKTPFYGFLMLRAAQINAEFEIPVCFLFQPDSQTLSLANRTALLMEFARTGLSI